MISLTEEIMFNPPHCSLHPNATKGWRRYRIEYGFECGCPEGTIYLPPDVDRQEIEDLLEKYQRLWVPNA